MSDAYRRSFLPTVFAAIFCLALAAPTAAQSQEDRKPFMVYDHNDPAIGTPDSAVEPTVRTRGGGTLSPSDLAFIEALGLEEEDVVSIDFFGSDANAYAVQGTGASNFPVQGDDYVILSSGAASVALDPNTSGSTSGNLGGPTTPGGGEDLAQFAITLNTQGATSFSFNFKFFSEEFPEFVGSAFNDGFVVEEGTSTFSISGVTIVAPDNLVFDQNGQLITINTTGALGMTAANAFGTTYDGATPVLNTEVPLDPEAETTTFIFSIFDVGDSAYDSAVFLDAFTLDRIDLEVVGFEVNQAVQDWNGSVPLIEGKSGIIRAFVQSQTTETGDAGDVLLKATRGGAILGTLSASNASSFTAPPNTTSANTLRNRRADLMQSLNFPLPASWRSGTVNLELMRPGGDLECASDALLGSDCAVNVTFVETPNPEIEFVRIAHTSGGTTFQKSAADIVELVRRARAIMPVDNLSWTSRSYTWPAATAYTLDNVNSTLSLMSLLECLLFGDCTGTLYGVVAPGGGSPGGGLANGVPGTVSSGAMPNSGSVYGRNRHVHETAHVQGVSHATNSSLGTTTINGTQYEQGPCGSVAALSAPDFPHVYNGRSNLGPQSVTAGDEMWGYDTNTNRVVDPRNKFDLMSYCGGLSGESWRWISDFTYNNIRTSLGTISLTPQAPTGPVLAAAGTSTPVAQAGGEQDYLIVSGVIDFETNEVSLLPPLQVSSMFTPPPTPDGSYTLEVAGENGVIAEVGFEPIELSPDSEEPNGSAPPVVGGQFTIPVPLGGDAPTMFTITDEGGGIIASQMASPNAPVVNVTFPNGGESLATDPVTIEWTASDADGDALTYTVLFSADGGTTYTPLVTNWDQMSLDVPLDNLAETTDGLIRVIASDGLNSGEDVSDATFITPNSEPGAFILQPGDGQTFDESESILFEGIGTDAEDGPLSGASLSWMSDLDGALDTGSGFVAPLSVGTHLVTLTATDSKGATGTAMISVTVEEDLPDTGVDEVCPPTLLISDFQTGPDGQEFIDLLNAGSTAIDFNSVNCIVGAFVGASYVGLVPTGVLEPGDTYRFGASLVDDVDFSIPDGTLTDTFAALSVLDRTELPNGTTASEVADDLLTSLVYFNTDVVYGFFHVNGALAQEYCSLYAGELHPFGQSLCLMMPPNVETLAGRGAAPTTGAVMTRELMASLMEATASRTATTLEAASGFAADASAPAEFALEANFPNPFNSSTEIRFELPERTHVRLSVYDILGREILRLSDGVMDAGSHAVTFDGRALPGGTYLYRIEAGSFTETRRMVLVR